MVMYDHKISQENESYNMAKFKCSLKTCALQNLENRDSVRWTGHAARDLELN